MELVERVEKRVHNVNSTENTTFRVRFDSCRLHYIDHNSNFPFHAKHASTHHGDGSDNFTIFVVRINIFNKTNGTILPTETWWENRMVISSRKISVHINLWSVKTKWLSYCFALWRSAGTQTKILCFATQHKKVVRIFERGKFSMEFMIKKVMISFIAMKQCCWFYGVDLTVSWIEFN